MNDMLKSCQSPDVNENVMLQTSSSSSELTRDTKYDFDDRAGTGFGVCCVSFGDSDFSLTSLGDSLTQVSGSSMSPGNNDDAYLLLFGSMTFLKTR